MSDLSVSDITESSKARKIKEARQVLEELDLPRAQLNDRSALTLLALLDLRPETPWQEATAPLIGITPIMDWCREYYETTYAPNTRETFRRQTMHQFVEAALVVQNPDNPARPVNSPKAVYQIEAKALQLLRSYGSPNWADLLAAYQAVNPSLRQHYARSRGMQLIPVQLADGQSITLTPGKHSELIKAIIEEFAPRFVPGAKIIYAGDTGQKWGYFDKDALTALGVTVDAHGKMPDVVIYYPEKDWLLLVESVTSHGPVDGKRHDELARLFRSSRAGLIYVTAFPTRAIMARYLAAISWETEVWVAEAPDHLIHFDGTRFLGPYTKSPE
jgi:type II restriction enzyme